MICEILSIGDELLIGQTVNTNATYMAKKLTELGHEVKWISTVGDHLEGIKQALEVAMHRSEIVLATGGLGPTHDDITKTAAADYFDSKLTYHPEIFEKLRERFAKRGLQIAEANKGQALVPDKAKIIENPVGTAPALMFEKQGTRCFMLPGVPHEMRTICETTVFPSLKEPNHTILFRTVRTTGIAESALYEKLGEIPEIEKFAKLAFLPKFGGVDLRLTARALSQADCEQNLKAGLALVSARAADYIYAEDDLELEDVVAALLIAKKKTVAVAESCTGGLLAHRLTNISGSSAYFERGVVAYSNEAKMQILAVPDKTLTEFGAVSAETAMAMAEGVKKISGADFGLSTTGIAGPTGGTDEKPVGLVYIGVATATVLYAKKRVFLNDRLGNKERSVQAALNLLRKELIKLQT